jgi:sugar/nucleoside kinase (ribokinase family)
MGYLLTNRYKPLTNCSTAKSFRYVTEPLEVPPRYLSETPLLSASLFHFLASPDNAEKHSAELIQLRREAGIEDRPFLIWEPAPTSCNLGNLAAYVQAARSIDIFSPNHIELAALFGTDETVSITREALETLARKFLDSGVGPKGEGVVIVRAGADGCCLCSRTHGLVWLPPYYDVTGDGASLGRDKVVDTTGAGNAFLGAYAVGLLETNDVVRAAYYGAVGSSFALEQVGIPKLQFSPEGEETWNGATVRTRLEKYELRVKETSPW